MCVWCVAAFCVLTVLGHFKSRIETTTRETFEFEQKEKASFHAVRFLKWLLAREELFHLPLTSYDDDRILSMVVETRSKGR